MPETELTTVEGNFIELRRDPVNVLEDARKAAKALTTVIDQKPRKVMIKGQVYLEYEDWQTVAQFYGYTVRTHSAEPVEFNGVKGAKAEASLMDFRTGMVVGGAEAYCMADEENWGSKPWFQLASMAQTRAGAKAIRNRMAWVVVLAGYSGTPAEEIIQEKVSQRKEQEEHWCEKHQTKWFKRGKMQSYAHPVEGTKGEDGKSEWCYEPSPQPVTPKTRPEKAEDKVVEPSEDKGAMINEFQSAHIAKTMKDKGYSRNDVKVWVAGKFGKTTSTELTQDEAAELIEALDTGGIEKIK